MRRIALTFDNGPEPGVTDGVLDVLGSFGVKATFFVIGDKLRDPAGRRLAERAHAEGHRIGNHTLTHSVPLGRMQAEASRNEIAETQTLLGRLAPERLFRPYGQGGVIGPHLLSVEARDYLAENGYTCVLWNVLPRDWVNPATWVEVALAECASRPHSLVVLHDLPTGAMRRLPQFLEGVKSIGGEFTETFPPECLPILQGKPTLDCDRIVAPNSVQ
jgi:peptidoglycan/xylan/chitin deacetylase (PgdA/CDA1 family)